MLEYQLDLTPESYWHVLTPDSCVHSFPFHVVECGYFCTKDQYYTRRDNLDSYLLIATADGFGRIAWHGQKASLGKGDAVLIDCNDYQEYATLPGKTWDFYFLHFNALSMEGYRSSLLAALTPVRLRSPDAFIRQIQSIDAMTKDNNVLSYASQSHALSWLITELMASLAEGDESPAQINRADISELAAYIREHSAEELHIEDFARFTRLSQHHLIRVFEKQIGMTPYQYLHKCRVNRSQELLRTTSLSVSAIASVIGYGDPIVFIHHFKTFHGITPEVYRKQSTFFAGYSQK